MLFGSYIGGAKIMISEQEQTERRAVVQSSLASQRIEGLEPDAQAVADAERWARGEMTIGAAVDQYKARMRLEMACNTPGIAAILTWTAKRVFSAISLESRNRVDSIKPNPPFPFCGPANCASSPLKANSI